MNNSDVIFILGNISSNVKTAIRLNEAFTIKRLTK